MKLALPIEGVVLLSLLLKVRYETARSGVLGEPRFRSQVSVRGYS